MKKHFCTTKRERKKAYFIIQIERWNFGTSEKENILEIDLLCYIPVSPKQRFCQTSSIFIHDRVPLTLEADKNPICFLIKKPGLLFCPLSSSWNVQMVFWLCLALGMRNAWEPWALRCNNVFDLYCSYVSRFRAGILYDPPVIANTYWVEERQRTHFDLFI